MSTQGEKQRILEKAYAYWLAEGQPHGRDVEHWLRAEAEINGLPHVAMTDPKPVKQKVTKPKAAAKQTASARKTKT